MDEREGLDSGGDVAIVPKWAKKRRTKEWGNRVEGYAVFGYVFLSI